MLCMHIAIIYAYATTILCLSEMFHMAHMQKYGKIDRHIDEHHCHHNRTQNSGGNAVMENFSTKFLITFAFSRKSMCENLPFVCALAKSGR